MCRILLSLIGVSIGTLLTLTIIQNDYNYVRYAYNYPLSLLDLLLIPNYNYISYSPYTLYNSLTPLRIYNNYNYDYDYYDYYYY